MQKLMPELRQKSGLLDLRHRDLGLNATPLQRFVSSPPFLVAVLVLVCLNMIVMGAETDIVGDVGPVRTPVWFTVESLFLICFVVEMGLKIVAFGWRFIFRDGWDLFDFVLVLGGVLELWIVSPIVAASTGGERALPALRILRLVRSLRLLRVMSFFQDLYQLWSAFIVCATGSQAQLG